MSATQTQWPLEKNNDNPPSLLFCISAVHWAQVLIMKRLLNQLHTWGVFYNSHAFK